MAVQCRVGAPLDTAAFGSAEELRDAASDAVRQLLEHPRVEFLGERRYRLTSGYMYTPQAYGYYDETVGAYLPLLTQPPNNTRLPLFHQLDLRVDKTWKYSWGTIGAYLDVLNVYNSANPAAASYDYNYTHTAWANDLPFLPSLGLRVEM